MNTDVDIERTDTAAEREAAPMEDLSDERVEEAKKDPRALKAELAQLLKFKEAHVREENKTPCAACRTLVVVTENRCPFCSSDIAAANALVRETLRRLDEITAELDADHDRVARRHNKRSWLKRLFSNGSGTDASEAEYDTRVLSSLVEGDQLTVLRQEGPWCRVRTPEGQEGWVFSTLIRNE